jgi:hypothetical protein
MFTAALKLQPPSAADAHTSGHPHCGEQCNNESEQLHTCTEECQTQREIKAAENTKVGKTDLC